MGAAIITMSDLQINDGGNSQQPGAVNSQLALQAWLSPAYPVGGYAYSHGLEAAAEQGNVCDYETLRAWIEDNLRYGSGWNDAIIMYQTARIYAARPKQAEFGALKELAELACALTATAELQQEAMQQGAAFLTDGTLLAAPGFLCVC